MLRRRLVIHGAVQGVFFRDGCREAAAAAGVAGWVRNTRSETVEAVLEGEADAVAHVAEWCQHGPEQARVDRVEVHEEEVRGESGFAVR